MIIPWRQNFKVIKKQRFVTPGANTSKILTLALYRFAISAGKKPLLRVCGTEVMHRANVHRAFKTATYMMSVRES
ncbi:hypothetical protein PSH66_14035 [Pseudomonas sp. FP597]|uniref:hypothetical protein n=1 Tax=Pseudomonas sp. FP597 TaxID=2954096 RepID=UPI0005B38CEB|nr:hypothetical protein [Pseudomonas sp. FP597]WLI09397.1 hypothetical protein PSH66_14035 [Pseudomonas sp. FP597]